MYSAIVRWSVYTYVRSDRFTVLLKSSVSLPTPTVSASPTHYQKWNPDVSNCYC